MVHFRIWPTAAAGVAVLATTAIAFAGPTPADTGSIRPAPPVRRPVTLVRHPVAVTPAVPRASQDADDNRLRGRIDQIRHENCSLVMRDRPTFDASILAGIIEQRQAECMRQRFNPRPFNGGFRDADDHRFDNGRQFATDDRRIGASRFDDRRDDRQLNRMRTDDRRDDRRIGRFRPDRDDRRAIPTRFATAARFQTARRFAVTRNFAASRGDHPMGRPRPRP